MMSAMEPHTDADLLVIDGLYWSTFTRLTSDQLDALRDRARRPGTLVDPRFLRTHSARVQAAPRRWAHAILGRPYRGVGSDSWTAFLTIAYALDAEPDPPVDPIRTAAVEEHYRREQAARDAEATRRDAAVQAWQRLRDRLPVPVRVLYNYSGGLHLETYSSGAHHIVIDSDLAVGRLRRRANSALCSTPSAAQRQVFAHETRLASDETRLPSCRACIRTVVRVTGADPADADLLMRLNRTR